jgi:uncharacterized protein YfaP (DUF2135 family)
MELHMRVVAAIVGFTCLCFVTAYEAVAAQPSFCRPTKYLLVFGNGVWNDLTAARLGQNEVASAVSAALPADKLALFRSDLAFNHTQGKLNDLLEAARQAINSDYSQFWRILLGRVPMPQAFVDALKAQGPLISNSIVQGADLTNHVAKYKQAILEGNVVTVVAHSQGNFFANESYALLTSDEKKSLGIVGVADPDTFVAGSGLYTTLIDDLVILAIRVVETAAGLPGPLPANTSGVPTLTDPSGHFFVQSYMNNGSTSRANIVQESVDTFNGLTPSTNPAGQGAIVATLTWGAQPDVDLHVFEPDGTHVYYVNKQGTSGTLDRDVVTGFGPEHYTVPCATIEVGTYSIGVNYFFGVGPETAHVEVSAGQNNVRGFDIPLSTAVGTAGNNSPIPVTTVAVQGSASAGYQFSIGGSTPQLQSQVRALSAQRASTLQSSTVLFQK